MPRKLILTTEAEIVEFKRRVLRYQEMLSLSGWHFDVECAKLKVAFGEYILIFSARKVRITLTNKHQEVGWNVAETARHEVAEIMTAKLTWCGEEIYNKMYMDEITHDVVHRIVNLMRRIDELEGYKDAETIPA